MASILCIETSTINCSVSICQGNLSICSKEDFSNGYSHAEQLHVFIEEVVRQSKINVHDLDAIAVGEGPGSYTGLRIGVSSAKGLSYVLKKPLIAVPTLETLARQVNTTRGYIVPMLDARRLEVYSSVFDNQYHSLQNTEAKILDEHSYQEYLNKDKVYFVGDGVKKFKSICIHPNAVFIEDKLPSAREMLTIAVDKYYKQEFVDVAYFEPYYLKDFVINRAS